jgi:hypothetical protein
MPAAAPDGFSSEGGSRGGGGRKGPPRTRRASTERGRLPSGTAPGPSKKRWFARPPLPISHFTGPARSEGERRCTPDLEHAPGNYCT